MPGGYGLDDYAGLLWEGEGSPSAVTARRGARAYRVCSRDGSAAESPLPARFLPAPAPAALREDIAEFRRIKPCANAQAGWVSQGRRRSPDCRTRSQWEAYESRAPGRL